MSKDLRGANVSNCFYRYFSVTISCTITKIYSTKYHWDGEGMKWIGKKVMEMAPYVVWQL